MLLLLLSRLLPSKIVALPCVAPHYCNCFLGAMHILLCVKTSTGPTGCFKLLLRFFAPGRVHWSLRLVRWALVLILLRFASLSLLIAFLPLPSYFLSSLPLLLPLYFSLLSILFSYPHILSLLFSAVIIPNVGTRHHAIVVIVSFTVPLLLVSRLITRAPDYTKENREMMHWFEW